MKLTMHTKRAVCWRRRPSGIMMMDLLTGLFLMAALSAVLFVGIQTRAKGAARLAESRAALRSAEAALGELQAGMPAPSQRAGVEVRISDDAQTAAPAGSKWVVVEATCAGKTASLRGLVPAAGGAR
jgi:hypothetical protein